MWQRGHHGNGVSRGNRKRTEVNDQCLRKKKERKTLSLKTHTHTHTHTIDLSDYSKKIKASIVLPSTSHHVK